MAEIDPKTGMKIRKSTDLKSTAAAEYQDAMMKRVTELHSKDENQVKATTENVIVKSLSALLDIKLKVDEMLGDNKDKLYKTIENILLAF